MHGIICIDNSDIKVYDLEIGNYLLKPVGLGIGYGNESIENLLNWNIKIISMKIGNCYFGFLLILVSQYLSVVVMIAISKIVEII